MTTETVGDPTSQPVARSWPGLLGQLLAGEPLAAADTAWVMDRVLSGDATPVQIAGFLVEPFAVPHDAREPIGLVIESAAGFRLGLVTDLGSRSRLAWGRLADLDALVVETNHDPAMLRNGPYPWPLKQRVAGCHGHLSNDDAADGVAELVSERLRWVVLYHLSQTNNLPALAAAAVGEALARLGAAAQIALSEQDRPTPWLEVRRAV